MTEDTWVEEAMQLIDEHGDARAYVPLASKQTYDAAIANCSATRAALVAHLRTRPSPQGSSIGGTP